MCGNNYKAITLQNLFFQRNKDKMNPLWLFRNENRSSILIFAQIRYRFIESAGLPYDETRLIMIKSIPSKNC